MVITKVIKKVSIMILILFKSFFIAVTQVAWGLASIFILLGANFYFIEKGYTENFAINEVFMNLMKFIFNNINWFVITIMALYLYFKIKEYLKLNITKE